jgi:hypothetical protein
MAPKLLVISSSLSKAASAGMEVLLASRPGNCHRFVPCLGRKGTHRLMIYLAKLQFVPFCRKGVCHVMIHLPGIGRRYHPTKISVNWN